MAEQRAPLSALCRLVLDLRLVALLLTLLYIPNQGEDVPVLTAVLVATALATFAMLRLWDRLAPELVRHPAYLGVDVLLGAGLLALTGPASPFFYFTLAPAAMAGLLHAWYGAGAFSVLLLAGYYAAIAVRAPIAEGFDTFQTTLGNPALYPLVAVAAAATRALLDRQAETEAALDAADRAAAVDRERTRIAREMHDSLAKTLHGISLQAWGVAASARTDPEVAAAGAETLADAAQTAAEEARDLIGDLRTDALELPLAEAVERDARAWSKECGVSAAIDAAGGEAADPRTRYELLGILKEALRNVERHSGARNVIVALRERGSELELMVADDGHGFVQSSNGRFQRAGHYGLVGMAERAEEAGGRLEITSAPGEGTEVRARVPLALAAERVEAPA